MVTIANFRALDTSVSTFRLRSEAVLHTRNGHREQPLAKELTVAMVAPSINNQLIRASCGNVVNNSKSW